MADKTIGQLPVSAGLDDNSLLVTEQGGETRSITGALVKKFAKDSVAEETARAEQAARDATEAKTSVDTAKDAIDQTKADIDQTKVAIDGIKTDIDTAKASIDQANLAVVQNKAAAETASQSAGTSARSAQENASLVAAALNEADGIVEEVTGLRDEAMNTVKSSVLFTEQQLTDAQKEQARANIGSFYDKGPSGTVKWNGATSNLVSFTVNESAELNYAGETYYLMPRTSSKVPSAASLDALGGSYIYQTGRETMGENGIEPALSTVMFGAGNGNLDSVSYPGATIIGSMVIVVHEPGTDLYGITVEKPGVYFRKYFQSPNFYQTQVTEMTLTGGTLDDGLERLPEKFLPENVLRYTAQTLTEAQKTQARENIGTVGNPTEGGGELFNAARYAGGLNSHAEGSGSAAGAPASHAEGHSTAISSSADAAHAEGYETEVGANAVGAHAEGEGSAANGRASHAEGKKTVSSGLNAHAEGRETIAAGTDSHSEGWYTRAAGAASHAEGSGTKAMSVDQHVQGRFNVEDTENKYAHIVGNGTMSNPANAHTLDWDGNAWFKGKVLVGGTSQDDADEAATKQYVDEKATWEAMPDKPFGPLETGGDTLTWDGVTDGKEQLDMMGDGSSVLYKVSDSAPSLSDFVNGCSLAIDDNGVREEDSFEQSEVQEPAEGVIFPPSGLIIVLHEGNALGASAGTYLHPNVYYFTIHGYTGFPSVKTIDEKYLPESVKGGSGGVVYVNVNTEDGVTFTADKTRVEIESLITAGANVVCCMPGMGYYMNLAGMGSGQIMFGGTFLESTTSLMYIAIQFALVGSTEQINGQMFQINVTALS